MSHVFRFIRRSLILLIFIGGGLGLVARFQPGLLLQLVGFQPQGDIDEYWIEQIAVEAFTPHYTIPKTPASTLTVQAPPTPIPTRRTTQTPDPRETYLSWFAQSQPPEVLTVLSEGIIHATFEDELAHAETFEIGTDVNGRNLGLIEFEEDAWQDICESWAEFCKTDLYSVRDVDFRPGGAIIYLSLLVEGVPVQNIGVTMVIEPDGLRMSSAGIILNNELYMFPANGLIANTLSHLIQRGNHALTHAQIQTKGYSLTPANLLFTEDRMFMILR